MPVNYLGQYDNNPIPQGPTNPYTTGAPPAPAPWRGNELPGPGEAPQGLGDILALLAGGGGGQGAGAGGQGTAMTAQPPVGGPTASGPANLPPGIYGPNQPEPNIGMGMPGRGIPPPSVGAFSASPLGSPQPTPVPGGMLPQGMPGRGMPFNPSVYHPSPIGSARPAALGGAPVPPVRPLPGRTTRPQSPAAPPTNPNFQTIQYNTGGGGRGPNTAPIYTAAVLNRLFGGR
jgi:hypothetical protein